MSKLLIKIQISVIGALCLLAYINLYFGESIGDNFFLITSDTQSVSYILYAISSFLYSIDFFVGPWILFPFIICFVEYFLIFSKREYQFDVSMPVVTTGAMLFISNLFINAFVGKGLSSLLNEFIGDPISIVGLVLLTIVHVFVLTKGKFFSGLKGFIKSLNNREKNRITQLTEAESDKRGILTFLKEFFNNRLHFLGEKLKTTKPKNDAPISMGELVESRQEQSQIPEFTDLPSPQESSNKSSGLKGLIDRKKVIKAKPKTTSYNFDELVDCITTKNKSNVSNAPDASYFEAYVQCLEEKLNEFGVDAQVVNIMKGPVVDTFEIELGTGVKVSKITSISEDLSLALKGIPLRIIYPMKGKTTVGIEVPRSPRQTIYLDEVLKSKSYKSSVKKLPIAMGKSAFGETFVVDLASMPHMLVAGETGAGKSVFINTLLVSLLIKLPPEKLKLILIDPKQLEMALYVNLPHLAMPVVSDSPSLAAVALLWACEEMERRYTLLKKVGVRNIEGFNQKIKELNDHELAKLAPYFGDNDPKGYELPYLVIVVDELADLMYSNKGKEIENNICRLAAKARASGIHLVLATQRPSVDVITGLIKANFPTRVSFRVAASVDSRTILNSTGAEKLLGRGDMLYKQGVETTRLHASFITESEIETLMDKICSVEQDFDPEVMEFIENGGEVTSQEEMIPGGPTITTSNQDDPLFRDAVKVVLEHNAASASMLQRRLKVGYNRAARLIEQMEEKGIVGPGQGSRPRKILMGDDQVNL